MRGHGALLALVCALAAPASAAGFCRTTTVPAQPDPTMCPARGVPVAWSGRCASYRINDSVLPPGITLEQFRTALVSGARAWATVICDAPTRAVPSFELVAYPDLRAPVGYFDDQPNYNIVTFRDHWNDDVYHPPDAAAITVVTYGSRSALILDADTEFNLRDGVNNPRGFVFSIAVMDNAAHLPTIITHEFGHTLGLAHSPVRTAVMWYAAGRGEQRDTPAADDIAGVCTIYPPTRAARCEPELRVDQLQGGGWYCAARGVPSREEPAALYVTLGALACAALVAWRRRRR
jgi:hypothetical protein